MCPSCTGFQPAGRVYTGSISDNADVGLRRCGSAPSVYSRHLGRVPRVSHLRPSGPRTGRTTLRATLRPSAPTTGGEKPKHGRTIGTHVGPETFESAIVALGACLAGGLSAAARIARRVSPSGGAGMSETKRHDIERTALERMPTGVPGLDELLRGVGVTRSRGRVDYAAALRSNSAGLI
jgi:hypothetical protein